MADKTALVTGASSGIGYELSKLLAKDGYRLVLVARNQERLDRAAEELKEEYGVPVTVFAQDLAMATAPQQIWQFIKEQNLSLDILINNAGFGSYGVFAESSFTNNLDMIMTNIVALTQLTHLFLPIITGNQGKIMNVASIAAMQPLPDMAIYAATKAYVLSFSEAIAEELRETGVTVTALCPGVIQTGFQKTSNMENSKIVQKPGLTAAQAALIGYQGMLQGKPVVVPGLKEKVMTALVNLVPRRTIARLSRAMLK